MGTFALFVGIAVVAVGLYALIVLQNRLERELQQSLRLQAQQVSAQLERAISEDEIFRTARQFSRLTGLRVTVGQADSVLIDVQNGLPTDQVETLYDQPEIVEALSTGQGTAERVSQDSLRTLYAAYRTPGSSLVIRLGIINPALYSVVARMQATLIVSMVLALVLALLGSWIASTRITRPLKALTQSARDISEGDLEEEIRVESRASEFQDLSVSLNRMAERFREDINDLQTLIRIQNEFLGDVSHEVRNPIFAISGYLEALGGDQLEPTMRERYAQKGLTNLQRLNTLFADLIEIARLEYRKDLIHPERFDLKELFEDIGEVARYQAEEKGLELQVRVTPEPMYVVGDRNRIRQVLTNLVENAIAYTDEGQIRCRYQRWGGKVRMEVRDTGKGIGKAHQERIFDRFYRVDPARSRKSGGSGLGLSIVKQILHAHGEGIHLESKPGVGSTFWFELPHESAVFIPERNGVETPAEVSLNT